LSHLILARHGNTFEPGDKIVWVGSHSDLLLTQKGVEQAHHFANALAEEKIVLSAVFCGPLQRTREFARIIAERNNMPSPIVDDRLNEIDYGSWSGLADAEIEEKFGKDVLKNWNEKAEWPPSCDWGKSASAITDEIFRFVSDLKPYLESNQNVIAVTSNGRLKYFPKIASFEFERKAAAHTLKVATGKACLLRYHIEEDNFQIVAWNEDPLEALKLIRALR
jgi:probable phosphoglycerate mutase